ncbi:gamma-glutamylcyclotransferase [Merismopedia glauca]|uniref:Gamma-glutamylcyclotransferase n=1 Tax=Merismopedia glauca CCAP 1448/3 TaxID=1296344 RepID=A0A2T1C777_9CYAN|nr:gamma-glutamylcyclotransferase [Merismopedia glauca]PSB03993.1 gamma-glutamylcyclotransferase [Merismopedia glauca CCAP 1448/3]
MSLHPTQLHEAKIWHKTSQRQSEPSFYYFAYGSCMCPVDLKRSLGEKTHPYVVGCVKLHNYRLGFYRRSPLRNCGVLDIVPDQRSYVEGVLYQLPWRLSDRLDEREEVPRGGYRQELVEVQCGEKVYQNVRTYVVVDKLAAELAPNDWYFNVVLRGAVTCGLTSEYCWKLFEHMHKLQKGD